MNTQSNKATPSAQPICHAKNNQQSSALKKDVKRAYLKKFFDSVDGTTASYVPGYN